MQFLKLIYITSLLALLSACGGGGGGGSSTTPTNQSPTVSSGADQSVDESTQVTLTGTASDADGSVASTVWTQTAGTAVVLNTPNTLTASFTAPTTISPLNLTFQLEATDNAGAKSQSLVTVTVNTTNVSPVADAGADKASIEGASVVLSGTGSDADGSISSVLWEQVSGIAIGVITDADKLAASFTAPATPINTSVVLSLTITDDRGSSISDEITIEITTVNTLPVVDAGADKAANEGTVVSLTGTATDADTITSQIWTQISGPTVSISTPASLNASFIVPARLDATPIVLSLTATDGRGTSNNDTISISLTNVDPIANAGADSIVFVGGSAVLDGSASSDIGDSITDYAWTQVAGTPMVMITAPSAEMAGFSVPIVADDSDLTFQLTVTDASGTTATDTVVVTAKPRTISGAVKYDNVPHNTTTNGLDYSSITQDPVRGAVVELLDATTLGSSSPAVVAATETDSVGNYEFKNISSANDVIVRVKAAYIREVAGAGTPSWDVQVIDNTNSGALYAMDSAPFTVTNAALTKNLTASSGWGGSAYTTARVAAPFHILDRAFDMLSKIVSADADVQLPALKMNWSINNAPTSGDEALGQIGTSFYRNGNVYILGLADTDTDEYDGHVIIHEMGHYFEDKLSRSDSVGGSHSGGQLLDMRVAFGEGFGNAWSGMITDDPVYRDSSGAGQGLGFDIDVESFPTTNPGWYSESSVQRILYDLYDATNEGGLSQDDLSLGFASIYNTMIGAQRTTPAFTSIFSFVSAIKNSESAQAASINNIVSAHDITSSTIDLYGSTEANDGDALATVNANVLPVYTELVSGAAASNLCSVDDFDAAGDKNKLSEYRFIRFSIPALASYTITATPTGAAAATTDPDFIIYKQGAVVGVAEAGLAGAVETGTLDLEAGDYVGTVYNYSNVGGPGATADGCFDVRLIQN